MAAMRRSLDATSMFSTDDLSDYDVISDGHNSLESSIADLGHVAGSAALREPAPLQPARDHYDTAALSADDIQAYVRNASPAAAASALTRSADGEFRTVRVYVDGVWDPFQARCVRGGPSLLCATLTIPFHVEGTRCSSARRSSRSRACTLWSACSQTTSARRTRAPSSGPMSIGARC